MNTENTLDRIYLQHGFKPIQVRIIAERRYSYIVKDGFGKEYEAVKNDIYNSIGDAIEDLYSFKTVIESYIKDLESLK